MNDIEKKSEISVFNVLLCLLVVFIHVSSSPVTTLDKHSWQFAIVFFPWRLSGFVVPGFIFLSGLKMFLNHKEIEYKRFYFSKTKKIIIPYIIWNIIYYCFFLSRGYVEYSIKDFIVYIFNGNLVGPFYFIIIIAQFFALAPLWSKMVLKINPVLVLVFSAVVTLFLGQYLPEIIKLINPQWRFLYTDRTFTTYLFYWVAGCYAGYHYDKLKDMVKQNRCFITIVFLSVSITDAILSYMLFSGAKSITWLENIHFIYCISTILFLFMALTVIFEKRTLKNKVMRNIDTASYEIYLMHCLFIYLINSIMSYIGINSIAATYLIRIVIVYSCSVTLSIILKRALVLWKNRNNN